MRWIVPGFALALALAALAAAPAAGGGSGIVAAVQSSPTCPVERYPPDPACAPRPFDALIRVVRRRDGKTVATRRTGADGRVRIGLPPARYRVFARPAAGGRLPACGRQDVTVRSGRYPRAAFDCDSGIR